LTATVFKAKIMAPGQNRCQPGFGERGVERP